MYTYFKGVLTGACPTHVVVEVQGIGYLLFIPSRLLGELPPIGESVLLYASFVVREFAHSLYGFLREEERDVFELLMNVSGIGPKLALSLIGHLSFSQLQSAIIHQNIPALCQVPGVGKKTAERLIVELKDKISTFSTHSIEKSSVVPATKIGQTNDAVLALVNLGYQQARAHKAVMQTMRRAPENIELAQVITMALIELQ